MDPHSSSLQDALAAALQINQAAEGIKLPGEMLEVRELVAEITISSGRLAKILAKRYAGKVQEQE